MKLVFLGPPGAGKGTHAKIVSQKYGLAHLATGDILRAHIRNQTPLGAKAKDVIEKGSLVSDDLVNAMMCEEIKKIMSGKGFILDGYPRTVGQAKALDGFMSREKSQIDAVINFDTTEATVIGRLSGRRICPKCNAVYHLKNIPPKKEGVCDQCSAELVQRKDDQPETIRHRLMTYHQETAPLIDFYKAKGLLRPVHGDLEIAAIQAELKTLFESLNIAV